MNSFICKGCVIENILYKRSLHYWEVVIIGGGTLPLWQTM